MALEIITIRRVTPGMRELVGVGTWDGEEIRDCTADLGEEVYDAIDLAIVDGLEEIEVDGVLYAWMIESERT